MVTAPAAGTGRLAGRVAIVTGSGGGIGRGIARLFAREGARVVVNDLVAAKAEATAALVAENGGQGLVHAADVADESAVTGLLHATLGAFGALDILVNNTGILTFSRLLDLAVEEWDRVMRVNTRSMFLCTREAARYWVRTGRPGKIVNLGSANAEMASLHGLSHYTASKGAVRMFTRTAAAELAQYKINVNAIGPGTIPTGIGGSTPGAADLDEMAARVATGIPIGRAGTVADVAELALYMASPAADYLTGQHVLLDGGRNLFAGPYAPI